MQCHSALIIDIQLDESVIKKEADRVFQMYSNGRHHSEKVIQRFKIPGMANNH